MNYGEIRQDFTVYCHANKTNGKRYVGITQQHPKMRWNYGNGYMSHPYFYKAIKKYGWDGFTHYLLFDGLTKDEALRLEEEYIAKWKCNNSNFGYNSTSGGEHSCHSIEIKEQISKSKMGHTVSEETRKKISESLKGTHHPISEETRKKIGEANKGKTHSYEVRQKRMKKVRCVETGQVFDWAKEAADHIGIKSYSNIAMCCRGERNVCGGFHWEYVEKESIDNELC